MYSIIIELSISMIELKNKLKIKYFLSFSFVSYSVMKFSKDKPMFLFISFLFDSIFIILDFNFSLLFSSSGFINES